MVLDICLQLLGDPHDAEDAFQAVFLVLARKARSIAIRSYWPTGSTGSRSASLAMRGMQRARRRKNEEAAMMRHSRSDSSLLIDPSVSTPEQSVLAREQAESFTPKSTVCPAHFGWRLCSVTSRASRWNKRPVDCVARPAQCGAAWRGPTQAPAVGSSGRGVALSTAAIASALASRSASAGVSAVLCETTVCAAMNFAAYRAARCRGGFGFRGWART